MSIAEEESTRKYYLLEGPEHGERLREKLLDVALENRHVIAQRDAYVKGRTAEPTYAEIEAGAEALCEYYEDDELTDDRRIAALLVLYAAYEAVSE
jgi:hypothetical protein